MRTLIRVVIVLAVVVIGGKLTIDWITTATLVDSGTTRVRAVLQGLEPKPTADSYQTAICQWWKGSMTLDVDEFQMAADLFDAWAAELKGTGPFEISASEMADSGDAILVTVTTSKGPLTFWTEAGKALQLLR